jgi:hypothetical protein
MINNQELKRYEEKYADNQDFMKLANSYKALSFMRQDPKTPRGRMASIHFCNYRMKKAKRQSKRKKVSKTKIKEYVNEFLNLVGMNKVKILSKKLDSINYSDIKKDYGLEDSKDIVWLKFSATGYLCTVACSNDINLQEVAAGKDVNEKAKNGRFLYNTSAVIMKKLKMKWDEEVLIVPLQDIPKGFSRHDIETGIGNYLISKDVPILDYYSHNY